MNHSEQTDILRLRCALGEEETAAGESTFFEYMTSSFADGCQYSAYFHRLQEAWASDKLDVQSCKMAVLACY